MTLLFFAIGSVSLLTLAEPFVSNGVRYEAGTMLRFGEDGALTGEPTNVPLGACDRVLP